MGVDMKNSEDYMDLVPYQVLTNVEKEDKAVSNPAFRPLVYICASFNGAVKENTLKATRFAEFAFNRGCTPFTPHLLFPFLDRSVGSTHLDWLLCRDLHIDTITMFVLTIVVMIVHTPAYSSILIGYLLIV